MVYVEPVQLEQVEYLISQSVQGHHILFDVDEIKKVFKEDLSTAIPMDRLEEAKQFLSELINQPSIKAKREYLERLPEDIRHLLIRTYFNILENSICQKQTNMA
ncbi:MAG TPA: hypothetical protein VJL87_05860 [Bdellovibrionota bacterium]|nr:hypothetical protein [Bdellovibrionota bacterium]